MKDQRLFVPVLVASVGGAVLWLTTAVLAGKREAWDSSIYWLLAYPISLLVCACLGYKYPQRPWRWALVLFEAQLIAMCLRNGELGMSRPMQI